MDNKTILNKQISSYWRGKSDNYLRQETGSVGYRLAMLSAIKERIAYDAYCFTLTDPLTLLSTGALTDPALQHLHAKLLTAEYDEQAEWSYEEMVRSGRFVTRLSSAAADKLQHNQRYQVLLAPAGFSDELRAAFYYEGQCWGFLTLFKRCSGTVSTFSAADEQQIESLIPIIGEALMHYYYSSDTFSLQPSELEHGFLLLSDKLQVIASNERGKTLLEMLQQAELLTAQQLPKPLEALGCKLLAGASSRQISLFIPLAAVKYVTIHATLLHAAEANCSSCAQQIAITIEEASPGSMLTFLMQRYKLTPREQEMVYQLLRGSSNKEIAAHLAISSHTVQDHLKSIFVKVGANSRSELVWKLHTRFSLT